MHFARVIVNAILTVGRVLVPATEKGRHETVMRNEAEMFRLLDVFEAEVHQDLYRPDVVTAINERLERRSADANFASKYGAALQAKVAAFSED